MLRGKKKGTEDIFFLPVCLSLRCLSTPFRNTSSQGVEERGLCFTYLVGAPAHVSYPTGVSSGHCERQRCLQGTSEQLGVDQTAKAVTVP